MKKKLTAILRKAQLSCDQKDKIHFMREAVNQYYWLIFLTVKSFFPTHTEDAMQDVVMKLCLMDLSDIDTKEEERLKNYLLTSVKNCCIDLWRKRKYPEYIEFTESIDCPEYRSYQLEKMELSIDLEVVLSLLTPKQQLAIRLMLEGFRYKEIADMLGATEGAVKNLIYRSKVTLKQHFSPKKAI